jgi:hypothetical protein
MNNSPGDSIWGLLRTWNLEKIKYIMNQSATFMRNIIYHLKKSFLFSNKYSYITRYKNEKKKKKAKNILINYYDDLPYHPF